MTLRHCLRSPIPEIEEAAGYLDAAVSAHLRSQHDMAREMLCLADNKAVWEWTDSVWGKRSPYFRYRAVSGAPAELPEKQRTTPRRATAHTKKLVHERDGYHCRFCRIPVVRSEVRINIANAYPDVVPWERTNDRQHAAFQCMWAQYDHILPHSRGGSSTIENVYLTCAACNYGRMQYTLEEVGLLHPAHHDSSCGNWDGLERSR